MKGIADQNFMCGGIRFFAAFGPVGGNLREDAGIFLDALGDKYSGINGVLVCIFGTYDGIIGNAVLDNCNIPDRRFGFVDEGR